MGQPTAAPTEVPRVFQEMGDEYAIRREFILEEHKPAAAARYVAAITHVHELLQPGEVVYVVNNTAAPERHAQPRIMKLGHGIYAVKEPGVRPSERGKLSVVGEFKGLEIEGFIDKQRGGYTGSFEARPPRIGSVLLHNGYKQPIEDLENTEEFGKDLTLPQFVVGKPAIVEALKQNPTESPAFNLQLAITAAAHGIQVPLEDLKVTPKMQDYLKNMLVRQMSAQATGRALGDTGVAWDVWYHHPTLHDKVTRDDKTPVITCDVEGMPPNKVRALGVILGLTLEELKTRLTATIDGLEAAILDGKEKSSRWPEVQVGRLRLDKYVDTVFGEH